MSVPHSPARYSTLHPNPVTEILAGSGLLSLLTLHPGEKFHGFRDTERLTSRLRPSIVGDVCSDPNRQLPTRNEYPAHQHSPWLFEVENKAIL